MSLIALQRDMRAWLIAADEGAAQRLASSGAAGLAVYQNNYRTALVVCLEASFPLTRQWLGDEAFLQAIIHHVGRVPPSSWTLDAYARDFPETLTMLYDGDPEVAELAAIELALEKAFVAPDAAPVGTQDLVGRDWDRAVLTFSPTLDLLALRTNAFAIWSSLSDGSDPPAAIIDHEPGAVAVWRSGVQSRIRAIDVGEYAALTSARAGLSFADLCERAADAMGRDRGIAVAGRWLGQWVADGLIVAIEDHP